MLFVRNEFLTLDRDAEWERLFHLTGVGAIDSSDNDVDACETTDARFIGLAQAKGLWAIPWAGLVQGADAVMLNHGLHWTARNFSQSRKSN